MTCAAIFTAQGLTYATCVDGLGQVWKALLLIDGSVYARVFMGVAA